MSEKENNRFDEKGKTPGMTGQSNRSNEPQGGLKNDREVEKDQDKHKKGDSTQAGTQNSTSSRRESGAGSGSLTEESRASRTGKFGPDHNSNTSGF